jgi:glycine/D-amino acid oxidase-like deaminating enzyme
MPVAVIGAGIVGAACARALQRAGHQVILLDPAAPGSGVSSGNAGHIAIDHVRPLARPDVLAAVPRMLATRDGPLILRWRGLPAMAPWLARFAGAALPARVRSGTAALAGLLATALPDWLAELQASGLSDMIRCHGAITVTETPQGLASARAEGRSQAEHGVAFQDLSGAQVTDMLPGLAVKPAGGRYFPAAAHVVHPRRLVEALVARFTADGGEFLPEPVIGFRRDAGRVTALTTPSGECQVTSVVLTAGLASPLLARQFGLHLPMTAERGYHCMLAPGALPVPMPVTFNERGFVVTPMEHGVRLAGTVEFGAAGRPPDWARASILTDHAAQLFGHPVTATAQWQGDRPTLPDYLPAIGYVPGVANMVVAAGHQHLGVTLAATTARLVAGLIAGEPSGRELTPFHPARFRARRNTRD